MRAADVMTTNVISVQADTEVREIAGLLLKHRISAVPVVNEDMHVIGLVSEGDLMRRVETGTDDRHSWWLADVLSTRDKTADYIKTHGHKASDVMTQTVMTVREDTPLYEIAGLLEKHHIKRAPVTRDDKLIGIVSRANLLHGLVAQGAEGGAAKLPDDKEIRDSLLKEISQAAGVDSTLINATVKDGVVQLWGNVQSETDKKAAEIAAECIPGVKSVENNIRLVPAWKGAY
jgi:CBS-domain-containing membrane protein